MSDVLVDMDGEQVPGERMADSGLYFRPKMIRRGPAPDRDQADTETSSDVEVPET